MIGLGPDAERGKVNFVTLGGLIGSKLPAGKLSLIVGDLPGEVLGDQQAADLALGLTLRDYSFDLYKTKKKDDEAKRAVPRS